ncbi:Gluconate transport-inducing protein [Hanseniaspora vineae]
MSNSNGLNTAILGLVTIGSFLLGAYASQASILPFTKNAAPVKVVKIKPDDKESFSDERKTETSAHQESLEDSEDSEEEEEDSEDEVEIDSKALNDIPGEVKMVLVIRQDLQMTKGKIAAQCCHAALACYRLIATDPTRESYNLPMTQRWLSNGQAKITLKCPNKETMDLLFATAMSLGVNSYVVHDAGRTQIASGSATVLGLGPAPKALLDQITGDLKLY